MDPATLSLSLTPHGRLLLVSDADAPQLESHLAERLRQAFERGPGHGLLLLGADEAGTALPPGYAYWREFGARYVAALCTRQTPPVAAPTADELETLAAAAPPMMGAEYLTAAVLEVLWQELDRAFGVELAESRCAVQEFLKRRNPAWNLVGRVHFNIAENRKDAESPFAFLATYTTRLSAAAQAQHLPLGQALCEYAGAANKERLLSLLVPVQRASETCAWLKEMVDAGEIFHPLRWTPRDAVQLLRDVPKLETAGVVVRTPAAWRGNRPPRPRVTGKVGCKACS
jgi:non-specific serine/threonine protein kinase